MIQILTKVSCGNLTGIPSKLPKLSSEVFTLIEIAVPVLLIIMGTLDLFKGITANKEDEIAKGRKLFVKRLITGVLVFFIFIITKFVVSLIDNNNYTNIISCMDCFINDKCMSTDPSYSPDYISCELNGYEFDLRQDGHIPGVSVYGNGLNEVSDVDDSLFNSSNSMTCPSKDDYEAYYDLETDSLRIVKR